MTANEFLIAGIMIINAAIASSPDPAEKYRPVFAEQQVKCLAMNMYHEARDQGTAGQLAVSAVVLNRVNDKRFPNSICEVIKQGPTKESWKGNGNYYPIRHRCQFSWYCDRKSDEIKDKKTYKKILDFAKLIMYNKIQFIDITDGATHYHADYVKPDWAKTKKRTTEIGDHIFYRWDTK